jgi:carboxypeptidase T
MALMVLAAAVALPARAADGGVGPYPPLAELYQRIKTLADSRPDLVRIEEIGRSVEGRPIYAAVVSRPGTGRPEALYVANIHAGEVIGAMVALGTLRRMVEDYGRDPGVTALIDRTDVWVVPVINPDGYERVISTGGQGGKLGTRRNAHGVDLNRNFPLAPGAKSRHPLAGNHRPNSSYYMGERPLSEPETRALAELADRHDFYITIMGHSVAGKVLYPHCFANAPARHRTEMIEVGQAYSARQPAWKYQVQQSYSWYPTLGDSDDFFYIHHGALAFTIEHGTVSHNLRYALTHPSVFWVMNPHDLEAWVENDADAALAAIARALEITGGRPYDPRECQPPGPDRP